MPKEKSHEISLSEINTFMLIDELTKRDPEELQTAIFVLLRQGKLKYTDLSRLYVKSLEIEKEDNKTKLSEGAACVLQQICQKSNKQDTIQRSLYFLNKIAPFFNIADLNKKYNYDEKTAKQFSDYLGSQR